MGLAATKSKSFEAYTSARSNAPPLQIKPLSVHVTTIYKPTSEELICDHTYLNETENIFYKRSAACSLICGISERNSLADVSFVQDMIALEIF